jgi:hypothetical protein
MVVFFSSPIDSSALIDYCGQEFELFVLNHYDASVTHILIDCKKNLVLTTDWQMAARLPEHSLVSVLYNEDGDAIEALAIDVPTTYFMKLPGMLGDVILCLLYAKQLVLEGERITAGEDPADWWKDQ